MIEFIPYIILGLVFLSLLTYWLNNTYDSINGGFLILFGVSALILRIFYLSAETRLYVHETFWLSGLIVGVLTLIVAIFLWVIRKNKKVNPKYFVFLLILYIFFGFLQQVLFQFVILETILYLTNSFIPTIILSAFIYGAFHKTKLLFKKPIFFFLTTFAAGLIWSTVYVYYGNLIWLGISHGVTATVLFTGFVKKDLIKHKVRFLR